MKGSFSNKDIILQKADKENSVVLVNEADYMKRMRELLSDVRKLLFLKKLLLNMEKKLISYYSMNAN